MTQSTPKNKGTPQQRPRDDEEETTRELVEALADAYFNACRKIARVLNRGSRKR